MLLAAHLLQRRGVWARSGLRSAVGHLTPALRATNESHRERDHSNSTGRAAPAHDARGWLAPNLEGLPLTSYEQDVAGLFDRAENPRARKWTRFRPFRCRWVCRLKDEQSWMDVLAQLVVFKEGSGGRTDVPQSWGPTIQKKFGLKKAPDWWSKALGAWTNNQRTYGKAFKKPASQRSKAEKEYAKNTTKRRVALLDDIGFLK